VKRAGHGADHLPSSSAAAKNKWNYTSTSPYALMVCTEATLHWTFRLYRYWLRLKIYFKKLKSPWECLYGIQVVGYQYISFFWYTTLGPFVEQIEQKLCSGPRWQHLHSGTPSSASDTVSRRSVADSSITNSSKSMQMKDVKINRVNVTYILGKGLRKNNCS